jgi:NhaP-type Na+/H+ or K+/H+ antiporter
VVPLAAALSIPLNAVSAAPLSRRDLILAIATAVVVVSLKWGVPGPVAVQLDS